MAITSTHIDSTLLLPTVDGEVLREEPEEAEGICAARIAKGDAKYWLVITYVYPIVSARAISIIPDFLKAADCKNIFLFIIIVGKLDE